MLCPHTKTLFSSYDATKYVLHAKKFSIYIELGRITNSHVECRLYLKCAHNTHGKNLRVVPQV